MKKNRRIKQYVYLDIIRNVYIYANQFEIFPTEQHASRDHGV